MQTLRDHAEIIRCDARFGEQRMPEFHAALAAYERSAGELEAKNAMRRLDEGYSQHPRETASLPPEEQIVRNPDAQRKRFLDAIRRGFR
jgi:hypothetical protein